MHMQRVFDSAVFQSVLDHPAVGPYVSLGHDLPDLDPIFEDRSNICLMNSHGGFLMVKSGEGQFDVHTAFVPEGRGPHLVGLATMVRDFLFQELEAKLLRTFVANDNQPAHRLAVAAGFRDLEEIELLGTKGMLMTMDRSNICQ